MQHQAFDITCKHSLLDHSWNSTICCCLQCHSWWINHNIYIQNFFLSYKEQAHSVTDLRLGRVEQQRTNTEVMWPKGCTAAGSQSYHITQNCTHQLQAAQRERTVSGRPVHNQNYIRLRTDSFFALERKHWSTVTEEERPCSLGKKTRTQKIKN